MNIEKLAKALGVAVADRNRSHEMHRMDLEIREIIVESVMAELNWGMGTGAVKKYYDSVGKLIIINGSTEELVS